MTIGNCTGWDVRSRQGEFEGSYPLDGALLRGLVPDEFQLRAAGAGGGSLDGDGAFEDLGFEERLHQFAVGAVA